MVYSMHTVYGIGGTVNPFAKRLKTLQQDKPVDRRRGKRKPFSMATYRQLVQVRREKEHELELAYSHYLKLAREREVYGD